MNFSQWLDSLLDATLGSADVTRSVEPYRFKETSHRLDAEEIDAIRQQNSKGFTVYEIDPNGLERGEFACVYQPDVMLRLTGYETNTNISNPVDWENGLSSNTFTPNPYWRSVYIDKPGTFLKIEWLEPRYSDASEPQYYVAGGVDTEANIWPQNSVVNTSINPLPNLGVSAGKRKIFLDFENPTNNPIDVKDGDVINTSFTGFWITFKQLNCRIRVTIGYNSEIHSSEDKPVNLHLWRGPGYLSNSSLHPVSFCITTGNGNFLGDTNLITRLMLIQNFTQFNTAAEGLSVGYISGFSAMNRNTYTTGTPVIASYRGIFQLVKVRFNSFGVITNDLEVLASVHLTTFMNEPNVANFGEPIRFTLRPQEGIALKYLPTVGGPSLPNNIDYVVNGWLMGGFTNVAGGGPNTVPFYPAVSFKDHPYPIDLDDGKPT